MVVLDLEVCDEAGLLGIVPYHSCEKGPQNFAKLTSDLLADSILRCTWLAQSGLGPIWALMFFVKNVTFRVQTAPFDKITIDFWRSRRRLYIPDLLKAKNSNVRLSFFKGVVFSSKVLRFWSRRLRLTKSRLISADLGSVYTIPTSPGPKKHKIGPTS